MNQNLNNNDDNDYSIEDYHKNLKEMRICVWIFFIAIAMYSANLIITLFI